MRLLLLLLLALPASATEQLDLGRGRRAVVSLAERADAPVVVLVPHQPRLVGRLARARVHVLGIVAAKGEGAGARLRSGIDVGLEALRTRGVKARRVALVAVGAGCEAALSWRGRGGVSALVLVAPQQAGSQAAARRPQRALPTLGGLRSPLLVLAAQDEGGRALALWGTRHPRARANLVLLAGARRQLFRERRVVVRSESEGGFRSPAPRATVEAARVIQSWLAAALRPAPTQEEVP